MKILSRPLACTVALAASFFMMASTHAASLDPSKIGLQLYSLRNQFQKDVPGTLDEVKAFGVKNVELAGTYNLTPEQFRQQLDVSFWLRVSSPRISCSSAPSARTGA